MLKLVVTMIQVNLIDVLMRLTPLERINVEKKEWIRANQGQSYGIF